MRTARVAVVDDSTFIRKALARMLADHPRIDLVGSAGSGEELLAHLGRWRPDVVTLDLDMPGLGGLATLDRLMALRPTPVIILSTHSGEGAPQTIEALHRGAIDFIDKQRYSLVDFESLRGVLLEKIFQVIGAAPEPEPRPQTPGRTRAPRPAPRRKPETREEPAPTKPAPPQEKAAEPAAALAGRRRVAPTFPCAYDVVVIGASTGGPPTIQRILEDLGDAVPVPIVVVQHMPVGFTGAFAERLNAYLPLQVREPTSGERLLPDTVYIAPAGSHLRLRRHEGELIAELSTFPSDATHIPSIDILFHSAAGVAGRRAIGVLLTGMGRDGAQGMAALKARGAHTVTQDEASCVVYGMPRAALGLGAVTETVTLLRLGPRLHELLTQPNGALAS